METNRRVFLELSAKALAAGVCFPSLAKASVFRAAPSPAPGERVLVVLELNGGNDGLNTVVPFEDDAYHKARPALRVPKEKVLKITDQLGFHPELAPLKRLFDQGKLAVVQGVGYPNPNRSHFSSMDIWQSGDPGEGKRRAGWLGRYFDARKTAAGGPAPGMAIGGELPLAMRAETCQVPSIQGVEGLTLRTDPQSRNDAALEVRTIREMSALARAEEPETGAFLRTALADACADGDRLRKLAQGYQAKANYQGDLGNRLRLVAQMVDGGFPVRVFYVSVGGFDTHAGQDFAHPNLLRGVASAIEAFFVDLAAHGHAERVALMAYSEFGRRVQENGSRGTDHGAAGPVLVAGGGVKGGVVGEHPSLVDLDSGDLKFTTDFRRVYATVLEKWLHAPAAEVLGGRFAGLPLFRGVEA